MTRGACLRFAALVAAIVVLAAHAPRSRAVAAPFPDRLDRYLTRSVKLTGAERQRLARGEAVTRMLEADEKEAVAVFGAIWIKAPVRRYVEAVKNIETLERGGGFKRTRRISDPPVLADFSELRLPAGDIDDLRRCRVGSCEVKLDAWAIERFRSGIDWNAPTAGDAANALMRHVLLAYVNRYLAGGDNALPVYRDKAQPRSVAREFRTMVDQMPELTTYLPNVRQYLLQFPRVTIPGAASFLYWQETEFGLKPTIRISHLTIREGSDETVVTSEMLYASHYFWTALELRTLVPDPAFGDGFWFVTVNRSRSDGLSGLTGLFARRRVRSEVERGVLAALQSTKARLEQR